MPSSPRSRRRFGLGVHAATGDTPPAWPGSPFPQYLKTPQDVPKSYGLVERGDELGKLLFGDSAQLADLEAAQLAGPKQVVDLVPADVQHLRYLLDCVCLQRFLTSFRLADGFVKWPVACPVTIPLASQCCLSGESVCVHRPRAGAGPRPRSGLAPRCSSPCYAVPAVWRRR